MSANASGQHACLILRVKATPTEVEIDRPKTADVPELLEVSQRTVQIQIGREGVLLEAVGLLDRRASRCPNVRGGKVDEVDERDREGTSDPCQLQRRDLAFPRLHP